MSRRIHSYAPQIPPIAGYPGAAILSQGNKTPFRGLDHELRPCDYHRRAGRICRSQI